MIVPPFVSSVFLLIPENYGSGTEKIISIQTRIETSCISAINAIAMNMQVVQNPAWLCWACVM